MIEFICLFHFHLNKIKVPQGIKCNDPNCRNHSHREVIDELYDSIVIALKKCSDALVSTGKRRAKDVIVPGWNEQVKRSTRLPNMERRR